MKYFNRFVLLSLLLSASACFGAYNAAKPADNEYVADVPALVRENFRAIKDDAIVNAGTVSGLSVGNASGNIPRSNGTLNTNLNADLLDGYHASAFNASDALLLRLDGSRAMTGSLKFSGNYGILQSTSDGADSGLVFIAGGGSTNSSRGGAIYLFGNEQAVAGGMINYYAGDVSTGDHIFYTDAGIERFRIAHNGTSTFGGNVFIGSNYLKAKSYGYFGTPPAAIGAANSAYGPALWYNAMYDSVDGRWESQDSGKQSAVTMSEGRFYFNQSTTSATGPGLAVTWNTPFTIEHTGNVLIGTTTDDGSHKLQVNGNTKITGTIESTGAATVGGDLTVTGAGANFRNAIKAVDGSGSGVDADTVDTKHASDFATAAQGTKADNALPSSSYTAADVLTKIKTVDGSGSGLDADTVDGHNTDTNGNAFTVALRDGAGCITGGTSTGVNSWGLYGVASGTNGIGVYGSMVGGGTGVYGEAGSQGKGVKGYAPANGYDFYASGPGTDYGTSSSIRWKKNRKPIQNALGIVEKLEGLRFTWDKDHGGLPGVGFIAEEVHKYLPEIVVMDPKAPGFADGMDYSKMTPLLLQAIKELDKLRKSDNAALLRKIEKQEHEIDELREEMRVMRSLFEASVGGKADYDRMDGKHVGEYIQTH